MLKDKIMLGSIIGILANTVKLTANYILYSLDWTNMVFWQLVAARFLNKNDLSKPMAFVIGGTADIVVSAVLGVSFVLFIYIFGREFLAIKGIGYGLFIWAVLFGTLLGQSVESNIPPLGIMATLIAHFIYGLALGLFTLLLYKDETLNELASKKTRFSKIKSAFSPDPAYKLRSFKIKEKPAKTIKIKPKKLT